MSLARITATGRGKLNARLEIEGWPIQPVTRQLMVQTLGDGRERVLGLTLQGLKLGARLNLPTGKIEAEGFRVHCVDATRAREIIRGFRAKPTLRTYLSAYVSKSATTIPVFSTDGWPSSGVLHIGTEAIEYSGTTSTSFTGCTRGHWRTVPQAHFTQGTSAAFEADGAALQYPEVTNLPSSIEQRRAWLWLYGEGDDPQGDGTQRWQGVCATSPKFEGQQVSFAVDPPTSILKQQIGGDVVAPVGIRGVYYPWSAPLVLVLTIGTGAGKYSTLGGAPVIVKLSGFWETNEAFCDALSDEIASATAAAGWGSFGTIVARPLPGGWDLLYTTASSSPKWVEINDLDDRAGRRARELAAVAFDQPTVGDWLLESSGTPISNEVAASTRYSFPFSSPFPRAHFGWNTAWFRAGTAFTNATQASTWPAGRIYLGGLLALSTDMVLAEEADPPAFAQVGNVSTTEQSVFVSDHEEFRAYGPDTRFRIGRLIARGNVGDLVQALIALSPDVANAGAMPLVTGDDIALTPAEVNDAIVTPAVSDRAFPAFGQDVTLEDLIGAELVAAGMHWTISTSGQLGARRARLAAATEAASHRIGVDPTSVTGKKPIGGVPTLEEAATWGFVSDLAYLTGYDVLEDEHKGPEVRFVNVKARKAGKKLELAQKSIPGQRFTRLGPIGGTAGEPTQEEIGVIARFWLGLLGGSYDVTSIGVPATLFDAGLGDAIAVSSKYIPDDDGTLGVTDKLGVLIGFSWDVDAMTGKLELLLHSREIAGYAPEFEITAQSQTGDREWELTLDVAAESDEPLDTWFQPGDRIRVMQWNAALPVEVYGEILSVDGDTGTMLVLFDSSTVELLPAADAVTWTAVGGAGITTGQPDPYGGTDAAEINDSSAGAYSSGQVTSASYTSGTPVRGEVWVPKNAALPHFGQLAIGYGGVYNDAFVIRYDTGATSVRLGAFTSIEVTEAISGWWRVRFEHAGGAGATAGLRWYPAMGLVASWPTVALSTTGAAVVFGPQIVYADWTPGSDEWTLLPDRAPMHAVDDNLARFAYVASATGRVEYESGTTRNARVFAP